MASNQAAANQHPLAEHKYMLTEQQNPSQMDHLRVIPSSCRGTVGLWRCFNASSTHPQMPASQISRSPLRTLMHANTPSRLLTSSTSPEQQEQQQQQLVKQSVGLAKPFGSIWTDQSSTDPMKDLNRHSATHTMGQAKADSSLEQVPAGEAALPAAVPLLPLLEAADFINEPPCLHIGSSESLPDQTAGHVYTSCFQQLYESHPLDDSATHLCLAAPTTLVIQQAPACISQPSASSIIPYTSEYKHTGNQQPGANEEMLNSAVHPLDSIQPQHGSQASFFHDHADSWWARQAVPQVPADAWHQQMLYDMHLPPHDNCFSGTAHDEQESTTVVHMPVQGSRSASRSVGQEQECPQADPAATGVAAESLSQGVQPMCHSSISTDSR